MSAKKFFRENTDLSFDEWQEEDVIRIMKLYARKIAIDSVSEERKICPPGRGLKSLCDNVLKNVKRRLNKQ